MIYESLMTKKSDQLSVLSEIIINSNHLPSLTGDED